MANSIIRPKPSAFLFDLDGTLIDSETVWTKAIWQWLASHGIDARIETLSALVFGHSWPDIRLALLDAHPGLQGRSPQEDARELRGFYRKLAEDPRRSIIASSVGFFKAAAEIAPCAIVSGSPHDDVEAATRLCGIDSITAFILGAEDYPRGKPAPDGYLAAAARLGVEPSACVVVEDSTAGVRSGLSAGMRVLGLDRNRTIRQDFSGCFATVSDLSEIAPG